MHYASSLCNAICPHAFATRGQTSEAVHTGDSQVQCTYCSENISNTGMLKHIIILAKG